MSKVLNYGIATVAAAASQFLIARRAGLSSVENAVYNTASVVTTLVASIWFAKSIRAYYDQQLGCYPSSHNNHAEAIEKANAKEKIEQVKAERKVRDLSLAFLASHALGWVAGSSASAAFRYNPKHMSSTLLINGAAFGIYMLVLLGSKEIEY